MRYNVFYHEPSNSYFIDYEDENHGAEPLEYLGTNLTWEDAIQLRNKYLLDPNRNLGVSSSSCLIIDGDYLFHRIAHLDSFSKLHNKKGFPTGLIYGILKNLCSTLESFPFASKIIYVVGGKSKFRKNILPTYKEKERPDKSEEPIVPEIGMTFSNSVLLQLPLLNHLIRNLNIHLVNGRDQHVEADDIIAYYAKKECENYESTIVVSDDNDFLQLVTDRVFIYRPIKAELVTPENFIERFQIRPKFYQYYKAIVGEGAECPQLVFRLGDATTIKFINSLDQCINGKDKILNEIFEKASKATNLVNKISENKDNLIRNLSLVDLDVFQLEHPNQCYNDECLPFNEEEIIIAINTLEFDSISSALLTNFRRLK